MGAGQRTDLEPERPDALLKEFGPDALLFDLGFSTADTAHFPAIQSDVAVAVNAALRDARIAIPDATAHGPPGKRSS